MAYIYKSRRPNRKKEHQGGVCETPLLYVGKGREEAAAKWVDLVSDPCGGTTGIKDRNFRGGGGFPSGTVEHGRARSFHALLRFAPDQGGGAICAMPWTVLFATLLASCFTHSDAFVAAQVRNMKHHLTLSEF